MRSLKTRLGLRSGALLATVGLILSAAVAGCASFESNGSTGDRTPLVVELVGRSVGKYKNRDEESKRLTGIKSVWRSGNILTVDTQDGIQYRFVDAGRCQGYYTCRRWIFGGSAQTMGMSPRTQPVGYWLIEFDQGEGGYWLAIRSVDGSSTVLDTKPAISADKHRWATGACNEESGDNLKILESDEFGGLILAAEAGDVPCCEVLGWDGEALKVKSCDLEPGKTFEDRLVRQPNGSWAGERLRVGRPNSQ